MSKFGFITKLFGKGGKVAEVAPKATSTVLSKTWWANGVKNSITVVTEAGGKVAKAAEPVAVAAAKGGKTLISWGSAAKAALVAAGGVVAYKWFGSGIPAFFANLFGTDEQTGSYIGIGVFAVVFLVLIYCVIGWFRGKGADFGDGKVREDTKARSKGKGSCSCGKCKDCRPKGRCRV